MRYILAFLGTLLAVCSIAHGAAITVHDDGVHIEGGSLGNFVLSYPVLISEKPNQELKPVEKNVAGAHATLKYDRGAQVEVSIADNGEITLGFKGLPANIQKFKAEMLLPFDLAQGGKWRVDGKEQPFPAQKPPKPHLYQGQGKTFQVVNLENRCLSLTVPDWSFLEVQDNREWNWKVFFFRLTAPLTADRQPARLRVTLGAAEGGVKSVVLVDEFGQDAQSDWPGKVKKIEELKADVESEKAYYAGFKAPQLDSFGGLPGSGAKLGLKKTGFFHVERSAAVPAAPAGETPAVRWHLVDPEGNLFFHLGVCSFGPSEDYTYVKGRERVYAWLPPYEGEFHAAFHPQPFWSRDSFSFYLANVIRKYGSADPEAFAARMIERVRALGFNSGGAFSGIPQAQREQARFPYVGGLPINPWNEFKIESLPGVRETFDPFDDKNRENLDKAFAKNVTPAASDPLLIGYFLCNEPAHEDLVRVIPTLKGHVAAKKRLVQMLQEKYKTIEAFCQAWGVQAASFEQLNDTGLAVKTQAAAGDMKEYEALFFDASHKLIRDTFRKYDANHILLGDRWQPQTANNEQLCRIVGQYCEVVSVNYYTYGLDAEYLKRIYRWSGGRPMFLSEFHWCCPKESGLPGGKEVASQQERGLAYRNYVEQAAALGFVAGIEWFTLLDQARTGRFFERYNGENSNCGLFSVSDRPWKAMAEEMARTNHGIYDVLLGGRPPFKYDNPRFQDSGGARKVVAAPRAPGAIKLDCTAAGWPGNPPETISSQRVVEGAAAEGLEAAFRLCWDDENLYLLAQVQDPTPMRNEHTGDSLWSADGLELFIGSEKLDQPGGLLFSDRQILLSAGKPGGQCQSFVARAAEQPRIGMDVQPGVDGKSYTLEAAIPWSALGVKPEAGRELLFDLGVDDSTDGKARRCQLMWNGTARNSGDRTHWGRLRLNQ
ncbi:MAG: sugar-binding protein [Planctomycetota bacterium]